MRTVVIIPLNRNTIRLSPRETEVLTMISRGYLTKQMARELELSEKTVSTHRQNMLRKTHTSTISELIGRAKDEGLL